MATSFYTNSNGAEFEERSGLYSFSAMFTSKDGAEASSFNYSGATHLSLDTPLKDWGSIDELMRQSAEQTRVKPVDGSFEGDIILTPDCLGDFVGYHRRRLPRRLRDDHRQLAMEGQAGQAGRVATADHALAIRMARTSRRATRIPATASARRIAPSSRGAHSSTSRSGLYGSNKTGKPRCPSGGGAIIVDAGETALADMVRDVKRGILLARFSGGSPSDNGDFSGVAKNSYLVEDGKIVRPIGETMVAGNVAALFKSVTGRIEGKRRLRLGRPALDTDRRLSISGK